MALKTVPKITKKQITENGVQKLADRPNLSGQYGASGLSAAQLKLWFDKLATLLAERINEISDAISSDEATNYIRVCLDDYGVDNLGALITAFTDGDFAAKILQLFPSAGSAQKQALQAVINNVAKQLAELEEKKLAKVTEASTYKRAYIIMPDGTQATVLISETALGGAIPLYTSDGRINVAIPVADTNAVNKGYSDAQDKLLGATVDLSIDTSTYVMTLKLKNTAGAVLSTAKVDFPIESVVIGGSCSGGVLALRLKSGETINVDISKIVSGLIDTATFNQGVQTLNTRIDEKIDELVTALQDGAVTVGEASKATNDKNGNDIAETYAKTMSYEWIGGNWDFDSGEVRFLNGFGVDGYGAELRTDFLHLEYQGGRAYFNYDGTFTIEGDDGNTTGYGIYGPTTFTLPRHEGGTLATQEWVNENAGGGTKLYKHTIKVTVNIPQPEGEDLPYEFTFGAINNNPNPWYFRYSDDGVLLENNTFPVMPESTEFAPYIPLALIGEPVFIVAYSLFGEITYDWLSAKDNNIIDTVVEL